MSSRLVRGLASCLTLLAGISCLHLDVRAEEPLPRVVVLATGGTIASTYDKAKGGLVPALTGAQLVEAVPELKKYARVEVEQITSIGSADMNPDVWLQLSRRANELLAAPDIAGVVVTHGTDTLEETAYFLDLTGFLAIDLAHALEMPLFDPDTQIKDSNGQMLYARVDPQSSRQRPRSGNGLIGGSGRVLDVTDGTVIVAANGGSDLIYVPGHSKQRVQQIVTFLSKQDYVGTIFLEDSYGKIPGALPFSSISLMGKSKMPKPALAVGFKTFLLTPGDLQTAVQIADSTLQEGQGMHGSFGRDNTFNTMAAIGPDFKSSFVDQVPAGNADIVPTLAHILGLKLPAKGKLMGRVLNEALQSGPSTVQSRSRKIVSQPSTAGKRTVLLYQQVGGRLYFDESCFVEGRAAAENPCR